VAKGGAPLLLPDAQGALRERLLPLAAVLTPNIPEAEALTGMTIDGVDAMRRAAAVLLSMGPRAVLLKGGHLEGATLVDVLTTLGAEGDGAADPRPHVEGDGAADPRPHVEGDGAADPRPHVEGDGAADPRPHVEERLFEGARIDTRATHGTGCTLASAVAAGLAQGLDLAQAVSRARRYLREAIRTAPGHGHGHGPLNHAHTVQPFF
jgi:hydroxymethylpyrimidine/phosphomethylpyrimidine kinase